MGKSIKRHNGVALFLCILGLVFILNGCGGSEEDTVNNPFVWPTAEFLNNSVIQGGGMDTPHSIVHDASGGPGSLDEYFYISNRGDNGGIGFVSRVAASLTTPTTWVTPMTAPTGMAKTGNRLLVVDGTNVVVIDTTDGSIVLTIAIPGAIQLKDIVVNDQDGRYYVSDNDAKRIFTGRYWEANASSYRYMPTYNDIGGLELSEDKNVLFIGARNKILTVNINNDGQVTELIDSLGSNFTPDGITRIYGSMLVICDTDQRLLWAIDLSGNHSQLSQLNTGYSPANVMAYENNNNVWHLYVPTLGGNRVNVYKLTS